MIVRRQLSDYEYALKIERMYDNSKEFDWKNFDRLMQLWRMYWGADTDKGTGQIPAAVVTEMIRLGKQPAAYNLCRPTVDNIAGGIMMAPFGFSLAPVDTEETSLTYIAKDIQYAEQEVMNWRNHKTEAIIGGLICRSDQEMYVDKIKYGKPYIGRRTRLPGTVTYDPKWKSPVSGDCRFCFVEDMLTPLQMLEMYTGKEAEIVTAAMFKAFGQRAVEELAKIQWEQGEEYGWNAGIIPYPDRDDIWGSFYKVIQYYHMEKVARKYEYVLTEDGEKIRLPIELQKAPSDEKIAWLNQNVPGWIPDQLFSDEETLDIQYMTAICPGLSKALILCNGPTEVQCGRLQFFPWSAYRANGEWGGIMDALRDMQLSVNWIENTLQYRLHVDGDGVSWYVDPDGFETPQEFERWKGSKSKAGETFRMKRGYLQKYPKGPAVPVRSSPYPKEAMDRLSHLIEVMWPKISKVNPAAHGNSESANEPAALYKMKKLQHDVEVFTIYESLKNFENEWGEAYLNQLVHTHGSEMNRQWYNPRTKKTFTTNKTETRTQEDGSRVDVIVNNLLKLRDIRHRVIVTESDDSPTRKVEIMQTAAEMIKVVDINRKPITYQRLAFDLTSNTETFSEDEKMQMEEDHELEMAVAKQELKTRFAKLKAEEIQTMVALQQLQGGMVPGQAGQAGQNVHPVTGQPMGGVGGEKMGSPPSATPAGGQRSFAPAISSGIPENEMAGAF
jgi:hypothetical protein